MAKQQGKLRNAAEYIGLLTGYVLLGLTPLPVASWIARIVADIWRIVDKRHRNRVIEQSMACLGISREAAERLAVDNYRHYTLTVMEIIRLSRISSSDVFGYAELEQYRARIVETLADGKGAVMVTGHLGNWEWGCRYLGLIGGFDGVIARLLDNPRIDQFVNDVRLASGLEVWYKTGAIRKAMSSLKKGRGFAAVLDQDGGRRGVMAPFLGRPASTMSLPVELALRTSSPIMVGALVRDGRPMRFKGVVKRIHYPDPAAEPKGEIKRLLTEINQDLSDIIAEYPEQWIWILNRWKTDKTVEQEEEDCNA